MIVTLQNLANLAWDKMNDLMPAIVQSESNAEVLMLGYMNQAALEQTIRSQYVTFFSRSKLKLWVKGETSGHKLRLCEITADCDQDSLLVIAKPQGPTCHLGKASCFAERQAGAIQFLPQLETIIAERKLNREVKSYTASLFNAGLERIAQKVGEEACETVIAALAQDTEALAQESADLIFHLLVLLQAKGITLQDVLAVLKKRHAS